MVAHKSSVVVQPVETWQGSPPLPLAPSHRPHRCAARAPRAVNGILHGLHMCFMSLHSTCSNTVPSCDFQAIDSIHQVGVYCLALVPANTLPKTPLGGIHLSETKQLFLEGSLHPCNVLMCPHTCVTNLPKPRQKQPGMSNVQRVCAESQMGLCSQRCWCHTHWAS